MPERGKDSTPRDLRCYVYSTATAPHRQLCTCIFSPGFQQEQRRLPFADAVGSYEWR